MRNYQIDIIPEPLKKMRFSQRYGRIFTYNPSSTYESKIKKLLLAKYPDIKMISDAPVYLALTFYLPVPKSTSKKRKIEMINGKISHIKKPDLDNLAYCVTNACKGILYKDDSQICVSINFKTYADKGYIAITCFKI